MLQNLENYKDAVEQAIPDAKNTVHRDVLNQLVGHLMFEITEARYHEGKEGR